MPAKIFNNSKIRRIYKMYKTRFIKHGRFNNPIGDGNLKFKKELDYLFGSYRMNFELLHRRVK